MKKKALSVRNDLNYFKKVRDFIALEEEEKLRLSMLYYSQADYLDLKLDEVVEIINKTSSKKYEKEDDWSEWLV